jgi:hypothetical protein
MQNTFTLHCIPWRAQAPLIKDLRMTAYRMGLLSLHESRCDEADESSNHALILSESGKPLGCARITTDGKAERMAVLPHQERNKIEAALQMIAWLN